MRKLFIAVCIAAVAGTTLCSSATEDDADRAMDPWGGRHGGGAYFSWEPWEELRAMQDRINRIMDDSYGRFGSPGRSGLTFYPNVDVKETEKEIVVKCDIPGVDRDQVDVTFEEGCLVIRGTRGIVSEQVQEDAFYLREREFGEFERVIPIEEDVQEEKISASFDKGVLTVVLPREKAAAPARRIKIL